MIRDINWILVLVPFIGAFIGWITNYLAIKLLFHPRQPMDFKIFVLHGIFPKNKKKLATRLGDVVQKDLISFSDIKQKLNNPESIHNMGVQISTHVENAIREKLHGTKFAQTVIPDGIIMTIHNMIIADIDNTLPKMIDQYISKLEENVDIKKMVYEKVNEFSDDKLENLILAITSKEFKFIEVVGAVLGFIIGLIQLLISSLAS